MDQKSYANNNLQYDAVSQFDLHINTATNNPVQSDIFKFKKFTHNSQSVRTKKEPKLGKGTQRRIGVQAALTV
jgi:hypothetical protein